MLEFFMFKFKFKGSSWIAFYGVVIVSMEK